MTAPKITMLHRPQGSPLMRTWIFYRLPELFCLAFIVGGGLYLWLR